MKYEIAYTKQFEKEFKKQIKRGKDVQKFKQIVKLLEAGESLPAKYRNHKLKGEFKNRWELHIEPDWLLVYKKSGRQILIERIGSHSDLF